MENKFTDNEIAKAWEKVLSTGDAPIGEHWGVSVTTKFAKETFETLNRQKAEIEGLKERYEKLQCSYECELAYRKELHKRAKEEARKEFAERLKQSVMFDSGWEVMQPGTIDDLVKEMAG